MNIENLMTVQKFCCCFNLKLGGLFVGYTDLLFSLIVLGMGYKNFLSLHFCVAGVYFFFHLLNLFVINKNNK